METPEEMPERFALAWAARDAERLGALFAEDADFVNVTGIRWRSREAIVRAHDYGFRVLFARSKLRVGRVTVRDLGEVAVVHARLLLDGQVDPAGMEAGPRRTVMSFVMAWREGGWICVSAQNTDIVPGAESHVNTGGTLLPADYRP
ncbi:SgcJ/EcaC family oxidoreductase [Palleronia sp. LCG004]|uniref:SgcJ/EcaC family oxidoreductase n=1 Tax=Palleronia sp. LCG004 TaxID=3079304 RepID=UPI002941C1A0|nr:SgcJ/EcaC family oxidoreductase [Palleronia sp. LCG004]WOI55313.1 SgcJ/EcaC family oxidoreductase [Palleronia sp. LCG004]